MAADQGLSEADRRLLKAMQEGFLPVPNPFEEVGTRLGLTENEVIAGLRRLKESGAIRRLGAIIDSRKIGYTGTLCAMKIPEERIPEAAAVVNSFSEVTHNYVREGDFNVWFTVLAPSSARIEEILDTIKKETNVTELLNLPARRIFKIRVNFDLEGER